MRRFSIGDTVKACNPKNAKMNTDSAVVLTWIAAKKGDVLDDNFNANKDGHFYKLSHKYNKKGKSCQWYFESFISPIDKPDGTTFLEMVYDMKHGKLTLEKLL